MPGRRRLCSWRRGSGRRRVVVTVGALHNYIGFGMQYRAKKYALTFDGFALWGVRNQQNSVANFVSDSVGLGYSQLETCYIEVLMSSLYI